MNKKIKVILLIVIALIIFIVPIYQLHADSGFGGSYSGSFSDGGSSSTSDGSVGTEMIFLLIVLVIVAIKYYIEKKRRRQTLTTELEKVQPYNLEKLRKTLSDFQPSEFEKRAFEIYKDVQIAWMNFDYETLRENVTDEMYNMYKVQLTTLKVKNQINFMQEIDLRDISIIGMDIKESMVSLTVTMQVECYDYIANMNGKVLRGTKHRKVIYNYAMTFNKGISNDMDKCPNCGAPIANVNSQTCPYCDSVIINDSYDWVLSKKQVLSQKYK